MGQLATYVSECPVAVWVEPTVSYVGTTAEDAQDAFGEEGFGSVKVRSFSRFPSRLRFPQVSLPAGSLSDHLIGSKPGSIPLENRFPEEPLGNLREP